MFGLRSLLSALLVSSLSSGCGLGSVDADEDDDMSLSNPHECFGFNLLARIESYEAPRLVREATEVFDSLETLQRAIDAKSDHEGAVFQLSAGNYDVRGGGIAIVDRKNLSVYSDPANGAILDGGGAAGFGVQIRQTREGATENIEVIGFDISETRYHAIFVGSDQDGVHAGSEIFVGGNIIHDAANDAGAGITVRNASGDGRVTVEANDISAIDLDGEGSGRGEGIYVGEGNDANHYSKNVVIRGNRIHDMRGEAIDIKRSSRDITIESNQIDNIAVFSQGAITLALDGGSPQDYEGNMVVRRNIISNVSTLASNGNAIVVANDALVEENLIFNIGSNAIDVYNDANGPTTDITIQNNIIWNYEGLPVRENEGTGNAGPNDPFNVTRKSNIVQSNAAAGECLESDSDFVGPPSSPSGFQPR